MFSPGRSRQPTGVAFVAWVIAVAMAALCGCGGSGRDDAAELSSLPRFGELITKVQRAEPEPADEPVADVPGEPVAEEPPPPVVDRSAFPTQPTPEAETQWRHRGSRPILHLQRMRQTDSVRVDGPLGAADIVVTDLSPRIGITYLAEIRPVAGPSGATSARTGGAWHLENTNPGGQLLRAAPDGLLLVTDHGEDLCTLWPGGDPSILVAASRRGVELGTPRIPLCGKPARVYLRLQVSGRKTNKEWTTDFLRDNLPAGEQLTVLVRKTLFADSELRVGVLEARTGGAQRIPGAPPRVAIDPRWSDLETIPGDLGLGLAGVREGKVPVGRWLPLASQRPGVWVSLFQARLTDAEQVKDPRIRPLDEVELSSMDYLVAFDLEAHDLAFALGTEHPRVGWSERAPEAVVDRSRPGPDGFADGAPLVRAGQVPPNRLADLQATFTGGFKRSHGAFKFGELSRARDGSHYGFVEDGVVWSRPVPGLATVTVWEDGKVDLHTWRDSDDEELARVRHLRQNGVPLLAPETGADGTETVRVGHLVGRWGDGNWSGSQDEKLRSVRAGLCLIESPTSEAAPASDGAPDATLALPSEAQVGGADRFLAYGWFSAATPSGMARVFLAYHCRYAMLLDMNALEHTYLTIFTQPDRVGSAAPQPPIHPGQLKVEHLVRGMEVLDETRGNVTVPRFAGFPDNRDFFYLTRKADPLDSQPSATASAETLSGAAETPAAKTQVAAEEALTKR